MKITILLAACLLAGSVQASGLFGGPHEPGQMPSRFIRLDAVEYGMSFWLGDHFRIGKVEGLLGRGRVGLSVADAYFIIDGRSGGVLAPVHVGFSLFSIPRKAAFFWSRAPDIYIEAEGGFISPSGIQPMAQVLLRADMDYYGIGLGLEAGWATIVMEEAGHAERCNEFHAGFLLRALTFGLGF